jgi:hypothetical protein
MQSVVQCNCHERIGQCMLKQDYEFKAANHLVIWLNFFIHSTVVEINQLELNLLYPLQSTREKSSRKKPR